MIENVNFNDFYSSIKDYQGITLHELEVRAMGTIFGVPGGSPEDTVLGTFDTANPADPIVIVNQAGPDVAGAFSGSISTFAAVDRALLPEDIKFCYRVTTATGVSLWHCIHFQAICPPGTATITVSSPDAMVENAQVQNWVWDIQAQRGDGTALGVNDFVLLEIVRDSTSAVLAYAFVPVGGDPTNTNDVVNENNWNKVNDRDGKAGGYITVVNSFSSPNLDTGNTQVKFAKKLWAVDNGLAGIGAGEDINIRVTSIDSTCNQTPTPDSGTMTPITFAEILLPFMGKQSATPYPEYRYPVGNPVVGGNQCLPDEWFGNSLRNGALTSPISEIRFDVDDDALAIDTFNAVNSPIHFPLPPLVHNDSIISCTGGTSTPLLGFDFAAYYVDPGNSYNKGITAMVEEANGHIRCSAEVDYDVNYFGLVTVKMNWSQYVEAENADDPVYHPKLWNFDNATTRTLIVRGDAAVYGNNTFATGLTVNLAFNVNNTRVASTGATAWTANTKVQISQTSGLVPGTLDDYDIISPPGPGVSGSLPATPDAGISAISININRVFPDEGIYYIKIVAETDASPDSKVFKSEAEGYLILASS